MDPRYGLSPTGKGSGGATPLRWANRKRVAPGHLENNDSDENLRHNYGSALKHLRCGLLPGY
jgi:hypothetical protein